MVDDERQGATRRDPGAKGRIERKAHVLHGRELLVGLSPALEDARDPRPVAQLESDVPVDTDQPLELLADAALVVDGDQQRARQVRGTG